LIIIIIIVGKFLIKELLSLKNDQI